MKKIIIFICLFALLCTNISVYAADKVQKKILKYSVTGSFHDGLAKACRTNSAGMVEDYGFVNTKGEWKLKNASNISNFSEGLAVDSSSSNKYNYINQKGKVVFTLGKGLYPGGSGHLGASDVFHDGRAIVYKNKNYHANGAINKEGKLVIPCKYWGISDFSNGYAIAAKDKKMGLIDANGKVIIPFVYEYGKALSNGFAFTKNSNFWEICEKPLWYFYHDASSYDVYDAGANLLMTDVSEVVNMDNGVITIADQNYNYYDSNGFQIDQYKLIDTSGQVLYTAPDGKSIFCLGEGRYSLSESYYDKQLIDFSGNFISSKEYAYISKFSGGYAVVQEGKWDDAKLYNSGKYGIINKDGKEIIPCKYDIPSDTNEEYIENGFVVMIDSATEKSILFTLPDEN
jgi:hypothetical protein